MATEVSKGKEPALGDLTITDNDDWEEEEGIPRMDDPMLQKYFQGRDALIVQEDKHRSDLEFRQLLSPMAREACAIVDQIRYEEMQTMWGSEAEEETKGALYPGMTFTLAKDRMEKTKLWQIIQKMPKGALLHCHIDAMAEQDALFSDAIATEGICFKASAPLSTKEALETVNFGFDYSKQSPPKNPSIWSEDYKPETLLPIVEVAQSFPEGGQAGFIAWLKTRCAITFEESLLQHDGPDAVWRKFMSCFLILKTVIFYEPIYRKFLSRMFHQLREDGIQYVDVRMAFTFQYRRLGSEKVDEEYEECIRVFGEEVKKFQATEAGKDFWGARIIWTTIRIFDNKKVFENMNLCIDAKCAYPDIIAGFDLVGQEDLGRPLAELTPLLFWFRKACAQAQVNIPFFFHAGETSGTGTETDHNLFDAIALGTRRIGHGFSLYKHPLLMNMVKDRRILVECCPISNEVLRLTSSISSHPFPALLAQGVPVSLSNDDPALLGQTVPGMSHDFWQALQGVESLGLAGLGSLAENSVRWAAFEDQDPKQWTEDIKNGAYGTGLRAKYMREWKKAWEKFCMDIVIEYGADMDIEDADDVDDAR